MKRRDIACVNIKLLINVKINEKVFSLVNVYAPNFEKERTEFF